MTERVVWPSKAGLAVGLDVGATKIAAGLVAFPAARVLHMRVVPTLPRRGGRAVLADCQALAEEMVALAAREAPAWGALGGLCLGVPELVDLDGRVVSSHTLSWRGLPLQEMLSRIVPAVVESDVRAAALGEAHWGAGRDSRLFVYLTVGSGISHTLMIDGLPFLGARGNAITCATSPLTTICPHCGARLEPIVDYIAAGPALVERYNAAGGLGAAQLSSTRDVLAAAEEGQPHALAVVRSGAEALGMTTGWLVNVLDPELLVVGGGLGLAGGLYWDAFVAAARAHIWSDTNRDLPIVPAVLRAEAGLVGAAAAAWRRFG